MQAHWSIDESAIESWRALVKANKTKILVQRRIERNIGREGVDLSKQSLWRAMVGCQVTTQQRSGPNSIVGKFIDEESKSPSPVLSYVICRRQPDLQTFLADALRKAGLWRAEPVAKNLAQIMANLEAGQWQTLLSHLRTLEKNTTMLKERKVARYLQSKTFPGIGPKQSRNYIQWLGLSRYEVPIDSRVVKALKLCGANFVPNSTALGDESVYVFVQDALQEIARRIDIFPCVLDAAIFASFEPS